MKKYEFRLEQVRRVRRTQEDAAKAALQVANSGVQRAAAAVEEGMVAYQQMTSTAVGGVFGVDSFMQRRYFDQLAGQTVIAARQAQDAAAADAAVKRAEWSEVASKVKVLDRLDERRREEYRVEYGREIDREIDDIVTGRFGRNSDGDAR